MEINKGLLLVFSVFSTLLVIPSPSAAAAAGNASKGKIELGHEPTYTKYLICMHYLCKG